MQTDSKRCGPHRVSWSFGIALLVILLSGTACARTIQGRVLDGATGQPIAGAVVLGVWTKTHGLGDYHTALVGAREAETDAEGRFLLERLGGFGVQERVTVYKFGYIAWSNRFIFPSGNRVDHEVPPEIRLAPFPQGGDHGQHVDFINLATSDTLSSPTWPIRGCVKC
jgi:hypothetical protein